MSEWMLRGCMHGFSSVGAQMGTIKLVVALGSVLLVPPLLGY